jgi:uncharacterized damage-inducible protein DinB
MPVCADASTLILADLDAEVAATRSMIAAFPAAHAEWRPHEKSRTLAALATHVARLPLHGVLVLTAPELDVAGRRPVAGSLTTAHALLAEFEQGIASFRAAVESVSVERWAEPFTVRQGSTVLVSAPRAAMVRTLCLSHLIHHRAQLGVHYRLLGVPVPGMYGPSADDRPAS